VAMTTMFTSMRGRTASGARPQAVRSHSATRLK
jgi:hypothetical protein